MYILTKARRSKETPTNLTRQLIPPEGTYTFIHQTNSPIQPSHTIHPDPHPSHHTSPHHTTPHHTPQSKPTHQRHPSRTKKKNQKKNNSQHSNKNTLENRTAPSVSFVTHIRNPQGLPTSRTHLHLFVRSFVRTLAFTFCTLDRHSWIRLID